MKKVYILMMCSFVFCLFSCKKELELTPVDIQPIVITDGNKTFAADPRAELLMIAFRLADMRAFSNENDYSSAIDKLFEKQKNSNLVKYIKKNIDKTYNSYNSILAIIKYISPEMNKLTIKLNKKELPEDLISFWGKADLQEFIIDFNEFAINSNFARIWKLYEAEYKRALNNVKDFYVVNDKILPWFNDYYFESDTKVSYYFEISQLFCNYLSLTPTIENNKVTINMYIFPFINKQYNNDIFITNNIGDGLIYYCIQKNWDKISEKIETVVKQVYIENKWDYKNFKKETYIDELLNILCIFPMLDYCQKNKDNEFYFNILEQIKNNSIYNKIDIVLEAFEYYQNNRQAYPNFEKYFDDYFVTFINEEL